MLGLGPSLHEDEAYTSGLPDKTDQNLETIPYDKLRALVGLAGLLALAGGPNFWRTA